MQVYLNFLAVLLPCNIIVPLLLMRFNLRFKECIKQVFSRIRGARSLGLMLARLKEAPSAVGHHQEKTSVYWL